MKALLPKINRKVKILVALPLLFLVWIFLAPLLAERLIVEKPLERADAILVLSGSLVYRERTEEAANLFQKRRRAESFFDRRRFAERLESEGTAKSFYVEWARWELTMQGVPAEAIEILPAVVKSTHDEAIILEKTAKERELKSVLLVTSGYHTRRALWTFEKVLRDNNVSTEIGIKPAPAGTERLPPAYWWLSARGWQFVAGEYLKTLYYWMYY